MKYTYAELAGMIDHALLHPTMTDAELTAGCELAAQYHVASVCIKPYAVKSAARLLQGTGVIVGTVISFPHGSNTTSLKVHEAAMACNEGATEVDMVINVGKALSGDFAFVEREIMEVVDEIHFRRAVLKVILETDFLLADEIKIRLCEICGRANVDFVKTSTGFGFVKQAVGGYDYKGATAHDLKLMRAHTHPSVKLKASGGIRTLDDLILARDLGASRCGTSATKSLLDEYRRREAAGFTEARAGERMLGGGGY